MTKGYHARDCLVNTFVFSTCGPIGSVDTLSSRMKLAREKRGLTQAALAKKAGVGQSAIGNIEGGGRPAPKSLADIAIALRVRYLWLKDGSGEMEDSNKPWPFDEIDHAAVASLNQRQLDQLQGQIKLMIQQFGGPEKQTGTN